MAPDGDGWRRVHGDHETLLLSLDDDMYVKDCEVKGPTVDIYDNDCEDGGPTVDLFGDCESE